MLIYPNSSAYVFPTPGKQPWLPPQLLQAPLGQFREQHQGLGPLTGAAAGVEDGVVRDQVVHLHLLLELVGPSGTCWQFATENGHRNSWLMKNGGCSIVFRMFARGQLWGVGSKARNCCLQKKTRGVWGPWFPEERDNHSVKWDPIHGMKNRDVWNYIYIVEPAGSLPSISTFCPTSYLFRSCGPGPTRWFHQLQALKNLWFPAMAHHITTKPLQPTKVNPKNVPSSPSSIPSLISPW